MRPHQGPSQDSRISRSAVGWSPAGCGPGLAPVPRGAVLEGGAEEACQADSSQRGSEPPELPWSWCAGEGPHQAPAAGGALCLWPSATWRSTLTTGLRELPLLAPPRLTRPRVVSGSCPVPGCALAGDSRRGPHRRPCPCSRGASFPPPLPRLGGLASSPPPAPVPRAPLDGP